MTCTSLINRLIGRKVEYLASVYGFIFDFFLGSVYQALDDLAKLKREDIAPFLAILDKVHGSGLLELANIDFLSRVNEVSDRVRIIAVHQYTEKSNDMNSQPGVNRALPLLFMTDELEKRAKLLDKRFPQPLLGSVFMFTTSLDSLLIYEVQAIGPCICGRREPDPFIPY